MDLRCPYCTSSVSVDDSRSELNGDPIVMIVCDSSACGAEFYGYDGNATSSTVKAKGE